MQSFENFKYLTKIDVDMIWNYYQDAFGLFTKIPIFNESFTKEL